MKQLLIILPFLFAAPVMAQTTEPQPTSPETYKIYECLIGESGELSQDTTVQYKDYGIGGNSTIVTFETAFTTGYLSVFKGHGFVRMTLKDTKQVLSFFGKAEKGAYMNGSFSIAGGDSWISVDCTYLD